MSKVLELIKEHFCCPPVCNEYKGQSCAICGTSFNEKDWEKEQKLLEQEILTALKADRWVKVDDVLKALPKKLPEQLITNRYYKAINNTRNEVIDKCIAAVKKL